MFRVSTKFMFQKGLEGMLTQQAKMGESQERIALGRRIVVPSDDPSGTAQVLNFKRAIATTEQYQVNLGRVENRLELEETVLASIGDSIPRVMELTVQGSSETYSADQRTFMAVEIQEILSGIVELANTRDSSGEYLFSGFKGTTKPFTVVAGAYTYNGDEGVREVRVSTDRMVADSDNGFDAFMDVPISAGGTRNIFETLNQVALALNANTSPTAFLDDLELALSHVNKMRAGEGGRLASLDTQRAVNEDFILSMETNRSRIEDLDYAEAITQFNQEQIALEAAQKSFVQLQGLTLFDYI